MSTSTTAQQHPTRQLIAAAIGNFVEWYDWYAYIFLATYFSSQIFPATESPLTALLNGFAVFAVGFFFRPIGGLVMGAVGDRLGRRTALTATILLMGSGSLLIALIPTYATIGIGAPILLVLARVIQGVSVGGEYAASTTFLVESAPPGRRGFFSSFQYVSTTLGQLAASGIAALLATNLTSTQMETWGWRVPFLIGAVIALVGLLIRRGAHETLADVDAKRTGEVARPGLFEALRSYPRQSLLIVSITIGGTIAYYTWTTYFPSYAETYAGADPADALVVSTIALAFFAAIQPLAGLLSDRIGRKPLLIGFASAFVLFTVPGLSLVDDTITRMLLIQGIGMVFLAGFTSISAAVNVENFPTRVRASGIGFPYSVSVALFGGTAPYVGTWFASAGMPHAFPIYVSALCLVSLLVYLFVLKETYQEPLPE